MRIKMFGFFLNNLFRVIWTGFTFLSHNLGYRERLNFSYLGKVLQFFLNLDQFKLFLFALSIARNVSKCFFNVTFFPSFSETLSFFVTYNFFLHFSKLPSVTSCGSVLEVFKQLTESTNPWFAIVSVIPLTLL